ncbi:MAG: LiaF-related protein [Paludibacter sp.]|nr:LiaF-related protein [Paludibacter sp.]MDD3490539.1 LiaF-related protein [Paludibacter sp.]
MKNSFNRGYGKGLGFGITLMLIGVLFLGFNFGILPAALKWVIFSWPMLLIFLGVVNWIKRKPFSGTVLFIIGAFFIFPRIINAYPEAFPGVNGDFTHTYWPLLLIAGGLLLILSKMFGNKWGFAEWDHQSYGNKQYSRSQGATGSFEKNAVFGSGEHIVLDPEFKGGEINAVFGGITLDLRKTNLPVGETRLEVNAVFGGVTIFVPREWHVESNMDAVFGGFEDKRALVEPLDPTRRLVITGSCVFGGGELKN